MSIQTKTLSLRVKDKHAKLLRQMAFEVNQVFNLANELTKSAYTNTSEYGAVKPIWLSAYDVQKLILEFCKERQFIIPSHTAQEVCANHAKARNQFKKSKLRWRKSGGSKRSLGWIPFKTGSVIGIDLGLKDYATCSDETTLEANQNYRNLEQKLGMAQRTKNKNRVKAIHAKIKNRRKDSLHKFSTQFVNNHAAIFVGDVSSSKLAKTKMAKSVLDAGWFMLKTQLKYKEVAQSVVFEEVNESYSTQTSSSCGVIPSSSPKARAGLQIREWVCCECGAQHDRDINAAKNILAAGHCRLAVGIPLL